MKALVRMLAAVLVFAMLLSGCSIFQSVSDKIGMISANGAAPVAQEEMPQEELRAVLKRLEYSALAAAIAAEDERHFFENGFDNTLTVHIADLDADGDEELLFGHNSFVMDSSQGKLFRYSWSQSGATYYTDCNGLLYQVTNVGGSYDYRRGYEYDPSDPNCMPLPDHLDSAWADSFAECYATWDGSGYVTQFTYCYDSLTEYINDNYMAAEEPFYVKERVELSSGEKLEDAAAAAYRDSLSLVKVTTTARDYTENSYDSKYQESICQALDAYFREGYSSYGSYLSADVDNDGEEEQVFLLPGLLSPWEASIRQQEQADYMDLDGNTSYEFDLTKSRTAVLLADRQGDRVIFRSGCTYGDYYAGSGASVRLNGLTLNVDGISYPLGGLLDNEEAYPQLAEYLSGYGYRDPVFLRADLADIDGDEVVCLCQKDGIWYILILCVADGYPVPLMQVDTSTIACYLTQAEGQDCLLTYSNTVWQNGNGYSTSYYYRVLRFDTQGVQHELDSQYVTVSGSDLDATELSRLMGSLQGYLVKIIVVRDPYALTGQVWVPSSAVAYGVPQEESADDQQEEGTLGFVQIQDPSSWLHLREGPGTEYAKVLLDPADPESYVRQALGSPVTVLETIETGDSENPVWVKIRIRYSDRELIGYSSKTYIRMQDEDN